MEFELPLRITLVAPPPGVQFCLQRGRAERCTPQLSGGGDLDFDCTLRAMLDGAGSGLRLLGPFAQGPPAARFIYICVGTYAGQPGSPWSRRIKVALGGITAGLAEQVQRAGGRLAASINGTARDGGPACASVPLLDGGWRLDAGRSGLLVAASTF